MIIENQPSAKTSKEILQEAIEFDTTFFVMGNCHAEYNGDAKSEYESADSVVIGKPDKSLQIQDSNGIEPAIWKHPGGEFSINVSESKKLEIIGESSNQEVKCTISPVDAIICYNLNSESDREIIGTENDMHKAILEDATILESGLTAIEHEYQTKAGAVDVLCRDERENKVIVEVKRRRVGPDAIGQLNRYVNSETSQEDNVRGILVAPSLTNRGKALISETDSLSHVSLSPKETISQTP